MQVHESVLQALKTGPKTLTEINKRFDNETRKEHLGTALELLKNSGQINVTQVRKPNAARPTTIFTLNPGEFIDCAPPKAEYALIGFSDFVRIMGSSSEQNLKLQLQAHPQAPKPVAKVGGFDVFERKDAVAFKQIVDAEKQESKRKAEEAALRKHAQSNQESGALKQELNKLRLQLEAAEKTSAGRLALASQRSSELLEVTQENQRLSVTVNQNAKTIADLNSQVRNLEATKRKFLSFLGWLAQIAGCKTTDDFDVMKTAIQATLEQSKNPDVEKLVATYKNAADLAERNYSRINEQHLTLLDDFKKMKQDIEWHNILVEHVANFVKASHNIKMNLWSTERAVLFNTLRNMGKLKK